MSIVEWSNHRRACRPMTPKVRFWGATFLHDISDTNRPLELTQGQAGGFPAKVLDHGSWSDSGERTNLPKLRASADLGYADRCLHLFSFVCRLRHDVAIEAGRLLCLLLLRFSPLSADTGREPMLHETQGVARMINPGSNCM